MTRANTLTRSRLSSRAATGRGVRAGATVERILEGALELLNRDGGSDVTTNHIAARLGMSPGNLYYHFRNREEIVRAIFPRVRAEGLEATAAPVGDRLTAEEFGRRHLQGRQTLWRYRFFFRDLNPLVARDPRLADDYRDYHARLSRQYRGVLERLIVEGNMRAPAPPADLERLVTTAIVIWNGWIPYVSAVRPQHHVAHRDVIEGALHTFLVIAPYLEPGFAAATRAVIERHGDDER